MNIGHSPMSKVTIVVCNTERENAIRCFNRVSCSGGWRGRALLGRRRINYDYFLSGQLHRRRILTRIKEDVHFIPFRKKSSGERINGIANFASRKIENRNPKQRWSLCDGTIAPVWDPPAKNSWCVIRTESRFDTAVSEIGIIQFERKVGCRIS